MQLKFQYDKTAVINALRTHFLSRRETKMLRIVLIVFFLVAVVAFFKGVIPYALVVVLFLIIILLTVVFWFILPKSIYTKTRTFSEPSITLEWDEETISIGTHAGARRLPWESFSRVLETPDYFYLYRNNTSFFLIPAYAFQKEDDRDSFSQLLHRHFSNYTLKRP